MKKVFFLVFILAFVGIIQKASAQSLLNFNIVNKTGYTLYGIYVTDANTDHWGKDILPQSELYVNTAVGVSFYDYGDQTCIWDMKITEDASEETAVVIYGLNLCRVSEVTIWLGNDGQYKFSTR